MNTIISSQPATQPQPERSKTVQARAMQAGTEFEAVLLNTVLGSIERSFSHLPGGKQDHATEGYSGFAMQALTSGLARTGGIGLGRVISEALLKTEGRADSDEAQMPGNKSFKDF
jgi:Rod binding domain-containing protein